MTASIVVLALAFFALSIYNAREVLGFIEKQGSDGIRPQIAKIYGADPRGAASLEHSLLLLEAEAMDKRYAQASALLMSRIWTRQLTFITGMVLAFIGAVFILGKLREDATTASLGSESWKTAINSSSPGLLLAFFGTTLIALAVLVQPQIGVQDRPIYIAVAMQAPAGAVRDESVEILGPALDPGLGDPGPGARDTVVKTPDEAGKP